MRTEYASAQDNFAQFQEAVARETQESRTTLETAQQNQDQLLTHIEELQNELATLAEAHEIAVKDGERVGGDRREASFAR